MVSLEPNPGILQIFEKTATADKIISDLSAGSVF